MYPIAVEFTRHWKEKVRNQAVWPSPHESIYIFHLMLSLCRLGTKKNISSSLVLYSLWSYLPGWGWKYEDFFAHINGKALEMCVWLNKIQNWKKEAHTKERVGKMCKFIAMKTSRQPSVNKEWTRLLGWVPFYYHRTNSHNRSVSKKEKKPKIDILSAAHKG